MKKKILIWMSSIVGLVALTAGVTYGMIYVADNPVNKKASTEVNTSEYKGVPPVPEAVAIGGAETTLSVYDYSTQEQVITEMHHMTHQKVVAEQKWGAIPMSTERMPRK